MYKRIVMFFLFLICCLCVGVVKIYSISVGEWLCAAAAHQGSYKLKVAGTRGNIYDCRLNSLIYGDKTNVATIVPNIETSNALSHVLSGAELEHVMPLLSAGKPFIWEIGTKNTSLSGINVFKVAKRYSHQQMLSHVIGYLNDKSEGVCGIERAYDKYLRESEGSLIVKYKVDAMNRILVGEDIRIDDTMYKQTRGVVLTIDKRLQEIAEETARRFIKKGAIVVTHVPSCEIRACVSIPGFSPQNLYDAVTDTNSPLINRAFLPYNVGSIYKLVTAAAVHELTNLNYENYDCTGSIDVDGHGFRCFNGKRHGLMDIRKAMAYSCNSYFVNIARKIPSENLIETSKAMGFGKSIELAPGLFSAPGNLPEPSELRNAKSLANLSFGQGTLMATPLQVAGLMNTIANQGMYVRPVLVKGLVNDNLEYTEKTSSYQKQAISGRTALLLKECMRESVEYGTSKRGKPQNGIAAAKTGTAQTGIKTENGYAEQSWYAGFYPYEKPCYSIVVLAEEGMGGGWSCAPAFKRIADKLYDIYPELLQ